MFSKVYYSLFGGSWGYKQKIFVSYHFSFHFFLSSFNRDIRVFNLEFSHIKLTNLNSQFNFCSISQLSFQSVFNQKDFQTTVVNFSVKFYQTIYSLDIQNFFFIVLFSKFQFQFQVLQSSFQLTTFLAKWQQQQQH